ncbi:hypothetical protein Ddc_18036 [Ditylenchus destructor]|nr:hypothetical protein Ddc_18036 [Ditylenchus destructor]
MEDRLLRCCWNSCPLLVFVRIISVALTILYFTLFILCFVIGVRETPFLLGISSTAFLFAIFSISYLKGIRQEIDALMLPLLTAEMILRVALGFALAALWISFVLSIFNLTDIESLIDGLNGTEFLLVTCICLTIVYAFHFVLFFSLYDGYRYVKKQNDRRRMCANDSTYMKLNMTARPTVL